MLNGQSEHLSATYVVNCLKMGHGLQEFRTSSLELAYVYLRICNESLRVRNHREQGNQARRAVT
jgi:hypothetical protein